MREHSGEGGQAAPLGARSPESDDQSCLKTVSGVFANNRCPETSPWSEWGAEGPLARGQGWASLRAGTWRVPRSSLVSPGQLYGDALPFGGIARPWKGRRGRVHPRERWSRPVRCLRLGPAKARKENLRICV